jgi:hypothetical protein
MAEQQDEQQVEVEEEVLELTEEVEAPEEVTEPEAEAEIIEEEIVVSFGDEAAPASEAEAPEWVRDLRKRNRELERELSEARKGQAPQVPEVGPEPTYESCEYDDERFKEEYKAYLERKAKAESAVTEAQKAQVAARERYQAKVETFAEQKQTLGVKDFGEAEAEVLGALSDAQVAILIHGAEDKAKLVYALGKHPEKLRQLAAVSDPIEFAFAAAKLEAQTKVEKRRPATNPESSIRAGSGKIVQPGKLDDKLAADEWVRRRNEQVRNRKR